VGAGAQASGNLLIPHFFRTLLPAGLTLLASLTLVASLTLASLTLASLSPRLRILSLVVLVQLPLASLTLIRLIRVLKVRLLLIRLSTGDAPLRTLLLPGVARLRGIVLTPRLLSQRGAAQQGCAGESDTEIPHAHSPENLKCE
jgi:hypothetical protein